MNEVYIVSHTMRKGKNRLPFIEKELFLKLRLLPGSDEPAQSLSYFVAEYFVCSVYTTVSFVSMKYLRAGIAILGLATLHGATVPRETQRWEDAFRSCGFLLFRKVIRPSLVITNSGYFFCASAYSFCICIEHKRAISYFSLRCFTTGRCYS